MEPYVSRICINFQLLGGWRYRSKKNFASSISIHPRSTGSIPLNSADHVVGIASGGPIRGVEFCASFWDGGAIPLKVIPEVNRSKLGECAFVAVLASISNGCPKLEENPVSDEFMTLTPVEGATGLYSPRDFLIDANVFSNSSIRLHQTILWDSHTHPDSS